MTVEAAEWIQAKELPPAQKAKKERCSAIDKCSYDDTCNSVEVDGKQYVKLEPKKPTETTQDQTTTTTPMTEEEARQAEIVKTASAQLADAGITKDSLFDTNTNLNVSIYYKPADSGGMGEVVVAVKGTELLSGKDWLTNIKQALGFGGTQYDVATNEEQLKTLQTFANNNNCMLTATGHSLGGGVATLLASTTYFDKAIVFNPAGVNDATFSAVNGDKNFASSKTTAYYSRSDILTMIQDLFSFLIPNAIGKRVLMDGAGLHPIDPVVKYLQQ